MATIILNRKQALNYNINQGQYNVMIRVTSPISNFEELQNSNSYRDVLTLKFFDLDDDIVGLRLFNKNDLEKTLQFFSKHKNCNNMVIHCDEGRSRSAGIAVGWFLFNDNISSVHKIYHDKIHLPNRRVVNYFYKYFGQDTKMLDKWEKEAYEGIM